MSYIKKITFLIPFAILLGFISNAQQLTCEDFKMGQFVVPEPNEMSKYLTISEDGASEENDNSSSKYMVVREENSQVEWKDGVGNGKAYYQKMEWINECSYRLTYDDTKFTLDEGEKWVNDNDGIVVTKTSIKGKCLFYKATMTTKQGKIISQNGILCKE